ILDKRIDLKRHLCERPWPQAAGPSHGLIAPARGLAIGYRPCRRPGSPYKGLGYGRPPLQVVGPRP
ncbi:hypothetical protein BHE74_00046635, partial [Ensete ventricosum]